MNALSGKLQTTKRSQLIIIALLLIAITFTLVYPVIPVTRTVEYNITVPIPGSPQIKRIYNQTLPLSTATFQLQEIDLEFDQTVNVTWRGTMSIDLIAILDNSTTESFTQTIISEIGVPIGPSLFTGKQLTPIIMPMIKEKLPEIMEKSADDCYYRINQSYDKTQLTSKAGRYNIVILSLEKMGQAWFTLQYKTSETTIETRYSSTTNWVTLLQWLTGSR